MQQSHVKEHGTSGPTSSSLPPLPTPPKTPIETNGTADGGNPTTSMNSQEHSNYHQHTASDASLASTTSHRSRKEYMDSLIPPSSEEMSRISQIQLQREQEERRKSRAREKEQRKSMDISRTSLDVQDSRPRRGSIFSGHRHKKTISATEPPPQHHSIAAAAIASTTAAGNRLDDGDHLLQHRAATLIQRTYRGYKTRREMKGLGLNADARWTHALRELKFREMTRPDVIAPVGTEATQEGLSAAGEDDAAKRSSSARYKWKKIAVIAGRAAADMDDDPTCTSDSDSDSESGLSTPEKKKIAHQKREETKARRRKHARMMGLQYFLEMVDLKHRYGSNLRTYHEEWKKADTKEPFFYWLDYGEGKNLDMTSCPRERLDREQVRYLSREERQYYVVQVDSEGRLCWAKNGARIDTTEKWKDSIHGIVPADDPTPAFQPKSTNPYQPKLFPRDDSPPSSSSSSSTSSSGSRSGASESELEAARAAKYASPGFTDAKGYKKVTHLSASTIFNTLLRKSVRKNTWIFVADTNFRLYVGIKDSGAFQHSSFLQGSRISAAGLIKIKNGRLSSLSPLSGHYRPPASNFRSFVRSLKDEGVDMSHVSISKSYAVLVGLEMYMKTRQKGKRLLQRATHKKDKVLHPEEVQKREEEERDKSQSAEKERQFLEKEAREQAAEEERRREENRAAVRVMQKLGITPVVPEGQKGDVQGDDENLMESKEEDAAAAEAVAEAAGGLTTAAVDESKGSEGHG